MDFSLMNKKNNKKTMKYNFVNNNIQSDFFKYLFNNIGIKDIENIINDIKNNKINHYPDPNLKNDNINRTMMIKNTNIKINCLQTPPKMPIKDRFSYTVDPKINRNKPNFTKILEESAVDNVNKENFDSNFKKTNKLSLIYPVLKNNEQIIQDVKIINEDFKKSFLKKERDLFFLVNKLFQLPIYFSKIILLKYGKNNDITEKIFLKIWNEKYSNLNRNERAFELLKKTNLNYLEKDDFILLIKSFIFNNEEFEFLIDNEFFCDLFINFIIIRIFFEFDTLNVNRIHYREFNLSNIIKILLDKEKDLNIQSDNILSYHDFYVCYNIFNSINKQDDTLISKEEFKKKIFNNYTPLTINRIFKIYGDKFDSKLRDSMNFYDLVKILLYEENKKHEQSIKFWFSIIDILEDGYITRYEIESFYNEQKNIIINNEREAQDLKDILYQIFDLKNIKIDGETDIENIKISLDDMLENKEFAKTLIEFLTNSNKIFDHDRNCPIDIEEEEKTNDWKKFISNQFNYFEEDDNENFENDELENNEFSDINN